MYRKPIYETDERYSEAIRKVIELKKQGFNEVEISANLSSDFKEKEIIGLVNDLKKLPTIVEKSNLKTVLIISLWILLFLRIFIVPLLIAPIEISVFWKLLIFFISLIIVGTTLYFAYNESYNNVFTILLIAFLLSIDSFTDNTEILFTIPILSISWWTSFIINSAFITSIYSAWKLTKIYPDHLIKLDRLIKKENLSYL